MFESELLTPKETAQYRRCSVRKLDRERAKQRGCLYVRIDGRIFYRRSDVDHFISAHLCGDDYCGSGIPTKPRTAQRGLPRKHANAE